MANSVDSDQIAHLSKSDLEKQSDLDLHCLRPVCPKT